MRWEDIEGEAESVLRAAELDDFVYIPIRQVVEAVLGPGALRVVSGSQLTETARARLEREGERSIVKVRGGIATEVARFAAAHEVGHFVLRHQDVRDEQAEAEADRFAAALLMPWHAVGCMRNELGDDLESLAKTFGVTQTAIALRIGEVGWVPASIVVEPDIVRSRSLSPFVLPPDDELRRLSKLSDDDLCAIGPGLRKVEITDDGRRVVLMVEEETG